MPKLTVCRILTGAALFLAAVGFLSQSQSYILLQNEDS